MIKVKEKITMVVNGADVVVEVPPAKPLLWVLREDLGLTGTKGGCEAGECGSCTVLLDGQPVVSCLVMAKQAKGREIVTVDSLVSDDKIDPVVHAFADVEAPQCGFCIPGFVMLTKGLLQNNPMMDRDELKFSLSGNLCRCGNYHKIFLAVLKAQDFYMREKKNV